MAEEDLSSGEVAVEVAFEGRLPSARPGGRARCRELFGSGGLAAIEGRGDVPIHPGPERGPDLPEISETSRQTLGSADVAGQRGSLSVGMAANLTALGRWVASTLVRLADLDVEFLPAEGD